MIKSAYYQFVNFIQNMNTAVFSIIWLAIFGVVLLLIMNFFKKYNGEQKKFEKLGLILLAVVLVAVLIYLSYIRK